MIENRGSERTQERGDAEEGGGDEVDLDGEWHGLQLVHRATDIILHKIHVLLNSNLRENVVVISKGSPEYFR